MKETVDVEMFLFLIRRGTRPRKVRWTVSGLL